VAGSISGSTHDRDNEYLESGSGSDMATDALYGEKTKTREEEEFKEPDQYRVILLNDDYTSMEFVVAVLVSVFKKEIVEATAIMLDVHKKGRGMVGIYSYDIAATKIKQAHDLARQNEYPLKCIMEKA
jgi:ATP-dependent Clp protease adaptor protein ClpS